MKRSFANAATSIEVFGPILVGLAVLILWEVLCSAFDVPVYLFPKPSDVWHSILANGAVLLGAMWVTLSITLRAFVLAVVTGTLIAFVFNESRLFEACLFPYANIPGPGAPVGVRRTAGRFDAWPLRRRPLNGLSEMRGIFQNNVFKQKKSYC
ncbi:ABC transporter permease [Mameliella alba]|uniref:Putative nitrate/sulfonate/bicarbonate ABC transporter, permease protein n=1 Tax=Mameliella alba TaxID=561184 RepID=A0A0B3RTX8_9RHOB|nr:hypothetical protein [Mameliella alba]KHQ51512.1 putative nitrate/sulfonate/bicarbonate ABC transporter, permease protein [Mameliella alba]